MIKLMIVDDEAGIRKGLRHYVDWSTWDIQLVAEAENGDDAFQKAIQTQPDILLSDIRMPGRDGIQLARELKEVLPSLRIIFLTGYNETQYLQDALKIGVKDYLLKPAGVENIVESVLKVKKECLSERNRYLESMSKDALLNEGIPILQMHFLGDVIHGRITNEEAALGKAWRLKIPMDQPCLQLALLRTGEADANQYRSSKEHAMDFWQKTQSMNLALENSPGGFFTELEPDLFLLLMGADTPAHTNTAMLGFCSKLSDALSPKLYPYLAIGVGSVAQGIRELPASYRDARRALGLWAWNTDTRIFPGPRPKDEPHLEAAHKWEHAAAHAFSQELWSEGSRYFEDMFREYACALADFDEVKHSCRRLLTIVRHLVHRDSPAQLEDDTAHLDVLLSGEELRTWMQEQLVEPQQQEGHAAGSPLVRKAQEYIRDHYSEDITLQSIAREIFVTPNYLGRIFREQTGYKLGDWLNKYRINQAKLLLDDPELKTYEIATRVGFSSYKYFSVCFLKYAGCSARDYRNKNDRF